MTKNERAARREWLDGLKAGNEVVVERTDGTTNSAQIRPIKHRDANYIHTQTAIGNATFRADNGRVADRAFHGPLMIIPVTIEHRTSALVNSIRTRLGHFSWHGWFNVSDATILAIGKLLDAEEAAKKATP
jgi:hypothetical protein